MICCDQFLTDVVNMDSVNPNISSEISDQPQETVTGSMECTIKHEHEYNTRISNDMAVSPAAINKEIEEVHKQDASIIVSAAETDIKQGYSISIDQCPKTESEFCENHALTNQDQDSMTENIEAGQAGPLDQSSHMLSGSMQIEIDNENSVEATRAVSTEPALKEARNDPEAFQHRGIHRRCLQFEDALHTVISNLPAQSPSYSGGPKSPLGTPLTPIKGKQAATIQPLYPRNMNTTLKIPKPSGIGLHLNSIVNAVQAGSGAIIHVKSAQRGNLSIWGKKSTPIVNTHLSDSSNSSPVFTLAENVSASTDDNRRESHSSMAVNSVTSLSTSIVKSSNNSIIVNPVEDQSTPGNKTKYNIIETDVGPEEFKSNPKKKRKKSSDSSDGDGCKLCNCKKSQCLKLYCDCFAAGIYCAEPCACQGCYNRPEYEDTVLKTREQIEYRNPLAFAPKIVRRIAEPPASSCGEDGTLFTPSSARHKRGCNCKKSMCLKKYCECYQANVGCSDGCRCEGCKNVYGKKGEHSMDKDVLSKEGTNERRDGSFIEKVVPSGNGGLSHSELCNPHNLTPPTPTVQFFNHRKDASEAWLHSGQYFQSPESSLTFVTPYVMTPGSSRNSDNNGMISETAGEISDLVSSDQELYYGNAQTVDEFSAVRCQPGKTGNLSGVRNPQERANNSKAQSFSGNNHYSSLSWHGSPNTPTSQFSASEPLKTVDLDGKLSDTMQDDTPDILKDSPTPLNAVKVSSPNKKRVSPPHAPQHEFGSSSLDGLRTGRKFILKAVPSFPPLTPCLDSKSIIDQQTK